MSQSAAPKKRLGARLTRAFFVGLTLGFVGGIGAYLLSVAVNELAATIVVNPIAFFLLVLGFSLVGSVSVELSKDLAGE